MQPPDRSGRTQHLLAAILAIWFAFLVISYHQRFPAGTLPANGLVLAVALLILGSAMGLGAVILRRFPGPGAGSPLSGLLALGIGLGIMEMIIFVVLVAGLAHPVAAWVIVGAGLVAGGRIAAARLDSFEDSAWDSIPGFLASLRDEIRARWWSIPVLALAGTGWLAALGAVMAPARSHEALLHHLAVPDRFLLEGGAGAVEVTPYATLPANQGMLYALAMLLANERIEAGILSQVLHLLLGLLSVLATFLLGRRCLTPGVGLLGAGLLATVPGFLLVATQPTADLAVVFFGVLVLALLLEARETERGGTRSLLLAGILAGLALGASYTALVGVCLPAAVWTAWRARRLQAARLREFAVFVLAMAAAFAPWAGLGIAVSGTPVSPHISSVFGAPGPDLVPGDGLSRPVQEELGALERAVDLITGPWRTGMEQAGAGGFLGAALIFLIPFVFLRRSRAAAVAPLAVTGIAALVGWMATVQFARHLFPALPAFSLLAALGAAKLVRVAPLVRAPLAACLGWLFLHSVYLFGLLAVSLNPFGAALGAETAGEYLSRTVDYYPAASFINAQLPEGVRVLMIGEGRGYYLERAYVADTRLGRMPVRASAERAAREGRSLSGLLREKGFTHVLVSEPEISRITRLDGRADYFAELAREARAAVRDLLGGRGARAVFERDGVRVLELLDE